MRVVFEVEMCDVVKNSEKTVYNNIHWDFNKNNFGITHLKEIYDDVSEEPFYEFYKGENLFTYGVGEPMVEDKQGYGGVFVSIWICNERHLLNPEQEKMVEVGVCEEGDSGGISWHEGILYADAIIKGKVCNGTKLYVKDK